MFGWLGWKTGWPLWRAYRRNQYLKEDVEEIFEGIAETRKQLLFHWTEENWSLLEKMEQQLSSTEEKNDENLERLFSSYLKRGQDFSELFLLDERSVVTYSTYRQHIGTSYAGRSPCQPGLEEPKRERIAYMVHLQIH